VVVVADVVAFVVGVAVVVAVGVAVAVAVVVGVAVVVAVVVVVKMKKPIIVPEGVRPLDFIDHHMHGAKRPKPIRTLQEAKYIDGAVLVIQGDWGGTIYCTVPAKYVLCLEEKLLPLATALERAFWGCNFCIDGVTEEEHGGEGVYFVTPPPGHGVSGGMGGGAVTDGLWVHGSLPEELRDLIVQKLKLHKDVVVRHGTE